MPYGDHALLIDWTSTEFSETVNDQVHMLAAKLRESGKYLDIIPGYDSLVCVFDLSKHAGESVKRHVEDILARETFTKTQLGPVIDIPVHYGGENGPDMETICNAAKLSLDEVIAQHSAQTYRVCIRQYWNRKLANRNLWSGESGWLANYRTHPLVNFRCAARDAFSN